MSKKLKIWDVNDPQRWISQQRKYEKQFYNSIAEINRTERLLAGQLILIATVVISITAVVLGNKETLSSLLGYQRKILLGGLLALAFSLGAGIVQYFVNIRFHHKWASVKEPIVAHISKSKIEPEELQGLLNKQDCLKREANQVSQWLQIGLIVVGVGCYVVVAATLLW